MIVEAPSGLTKWRDRVLASLSATRRRLGDGYRRARATRWSTPAWARGLIERIGEALRATALRVFAFLKWLAVPAGSTPFDVLKHYVSVILFVIGVTSLFWAGKQIAYPPLVITVGEVPEAVKTERWLNLEIARALIDQIERMRSVVKRERDPNFEAVLDPPNIVVKSNEFSLNVQEQLLTPLGSLLGRSPGEVHLALTCFYPGCLRSKDNECREAVPAKSGEDAAGRAAALPNTYLCLRLTADIRGGGVSRRSSVRLALNNENYSVEMSAQMAKIAEEVASVGDPATAALYFYRRVKQEGPASRSASNAPDLVADLRGAAFRAAEQAEAHDAASACWAHSVRARMAIDSRDFKLAETYIARAKKISRWRDLHLTRPFDCRRLIAVTEIAFARQLTLESPEESYPPYWEDADKRRQRAAFRQISRIVAETGGRERSWGGYVTKKLIGSDPNEAARFAQAEIGLGWFNAQDECELLDGKPFDAAESLDPSDVAEEGDTEEQAKTRLPSVEAIRRKAWAAIQSAVGTINALPPRDPLTPLTRHAAQTPPSPDPFTPLARQAALDFAERLARNKECPEQVQLLAERLYLSHPNDPEMARLLAELVEALALAGPKPLGSAEITAEDETKRPGLEIARRIYQRMVDVGDDKIDIFALGRLALINTAFTRVPSEPDKLARDVFPHLARAWQRFQRGDYPTDVRHHAENLLTLWGSLLLASHPQEILTADLSHPVDAGQAKDTKSEFQRAVRALFSEQPKRMADFTRLKHIGPGIRCLCTLMRISQEEEDGTTFFLTRVNDWQQRGFSRLGSCTRSLQPRPPRRLTSAAIARSGRTRQEANQQFSRAMAAYRAALTERRAKIDEADALCHVEQEPTPPSPQSDTAPPTPIPLPVHD